MRVLFFHPEKYLNYGIPAGISILSAIIKKAGHTVDLFDTTFLKTKDKNDGHHLEVNDDSKNASAGDVFDVPIDDEENSELAGKQSAGLFKETAYSMDDLIRDDPYVVLEDELQKKIDEFKPDVIALSTMTATFDSAVNLLRKVTYDAKVIVGGVHPTIASDDCLAQDVIDIACVGEADDTFLELLDLMDKGEDYFHVKSMNFKLPDGKIIKNPIAPRVELNDLPTPDWGLFDSRHLFRPFDGEIYQGSFYSQARGCPMQCTYCVDPTIAEITGGRKNYFRIQDPQVTFNQLSELKEQFNATWFKFVDDTFLMPQISHLEELRDLIAPLNIMFGCSVMPNTIREDKVKLAVEMGCVAMSVGIESGNDEVRRSVKRFYRNDNVVKKLKMAQSYGIRVSTFNIIGFPGETRENVFETIELNRQIGSNAANAYVLYPYHGTPIAVEQKIPLRDGEGNIPTIDIGHTLGFSEMSSDELLGLRSTFNLYLMLPKGLYPVIYFAEAQTELGNVFLNELTKLTVAQLSNTTLPTTSLADLIAEDSALTTLDLDVQVPTLFSKLLKLAITTEMKQTIVLALIDVYNEEMLLTGSGA
ncbi:MULTISPECIES: radical SAM protein [Thalassotalea]|uniref:Radical SAM protein n=1 Tax=Thalassotalea castellviae TaxID=3075612 RepID=A0ABU2ZY53_9GAMM|nr:radical SAM protein [Thalassotalea sp. W431]MDT0602861.1 radical SAM protein [Thalassotalea sp. W431]